MKKLIEIQPIVSICCITYNHGKYIRDAIEGFLMQKISFPIEILIHDDASTDKTADIIREYKLKYPDIIKPIYQTENQYSKGISISATYQFPRARGKYIALCEGDDYWTDPYKLQKQVDFLEANAEYGLVSTDIDLIDENGKHIPDNNMVLKQRANYKPTVDFFDLLKVNHVNTLTVCVRAYLMKELAGRVAKENLWFVYDYWFWLNISLKCKIGILSEKMAAYRVHSGGVSRQNNFFNVIKALVRKDALYQALKQNRLNTKQFYSKYGALLYHLFRSRNLKALAYVLKLKN